MTWENPGLTWALHAKSLCAWTTKCMSDISLAFSQVLLQSKKNKKKILLFGVILTISLQVCPCFGSTSAMLDYLGTFLQGNPRLVFSKRWQQFVLAGLTPTSRSCNIISYWFLVDLTWSSHHSVMCSTRLLNEINRPPQSNRSLWELSAITVRAWVVFVRETLDYGIISRKETKKLRCITQTSIHEWH